MELQEIRRMVFGGENEQVEFKQKIRHPEKVVREIVAFANSNGGYLLVGVSDDKKITGLKYADEEDFILTRAIKELCSPKIAFQSTIIPLDDEKAILCYQIFAGKKKPYYARENKKDRYGRAFVRVGDRSIQASPEIRKVLRLTNSPIGVHIEYGDNEKQLFNFLNTHHKITLRQYRELTGQTYKEASNTIARLVAAKILAIIPREKEDWYSAYPVSAGVMNSR